MAGTLFDDMLIDTILRNKAREEARAGKWAEATRYYRKLCGGRHSNAKDLVQFGHALKEAGDHEEALSVYLRAADMHRTDVDAQRQAGLFLRRLERGNGAALYFARALAIDGNLDDVKNEISELGVMDTAALDAAMLRGALLGSELPSRTPGLIARLLMSATLKHARVSAKNGDWSRAEQAYRKVLKRAPTQASLLIQFGHALREQNKLEGALIAYRHAILLAPRNPDQYIHMGHALKSLGRRDAALAAYLTSWRLRPGRPEVLMEIRAFREDFSEHDLGWDPGAHVSASLHRQDGEPHAVGGVERMERAQLAEEPWLNHQQRRVFKYLSGSLAYKE